MIFTTKKILYHLQGQIASELTRKSRKFATCIFYTHFKENDIMKIEKLPSGSYRIRKMYKGKSYQIVTDYKPTQKEAI